MPESFQIFAVDPLAANLKTLFLQQLPTGSISFLCPESAQDEELMAIVRGAHALVTRQRLVIGEILRAAGPRLRLVQVMGQVELCAPPCSAGAFCSKIPPVIGFDCTMPAGLPPK